MATQLTSALIMAVVSALAFIAYRHPRGYAKMFKPLITAVICSYVAWNIFDAGRLVGFYETESAYSRLNPGVKLAEPEFRLSPLWAREILPFAFIYLLILKCLPDILDLPKGDGKKDMPNTEVNKEGSEGAS